MFTIHQGCFGEVKVATTSIISHNMQHLLKLLNSLVLFGWFSLLVKPFSASA